MSSPKPCPDAGLLQQFLQGEVSEEVANGLESHLGECEPCLEVAAGIETVVNRSGDTSFPNAPNDTKTIDLLKQRFVVLIEAERKSAIEKATAISVGGDTASELAKLEYQALLLPALDGEEGIGRIARYAILRLLGSGGMGFVFLARDPRMRRLVALKVMKPGLAAKAEHKERFLREARAMAAVRNDHVVEVYHVDEDRGIPFLEMPLLEGESLKDRCDRLGKLPVKELLRISKEIAQGLAAAHGKRLVHRDVKPANIWLEAGTDRVKILDFGLALDSDSDIALTNPGTIMGTAAYMSPEQAMRRNDAIDLRSDLFSLGCVMYEMATGKAPFERKSLIETLEAVVRATPPAPAELRPELPREFSSLVMQLLSKAREQRPESAEAVISQIETVQRRPQSRKGIPAPSRATSTAPRTDSVESGRGRRPKLGVILAAGAAACLLAGVIIVIKNRDGKTVATHELKDGETFEATPKPDPPAPNYAVDVRAAEFVLQHGGGVSVVYPSGQEEGFYAAKLSRTDFKLLGVQLGNTPLAELVPLLSVIADSRLARLALDGNQATDADLALLAKIATLQNLNLSGDQRLTDAGLRQLASLPDLKELNLENTPVTNAGMIHVGKIHSLEHLSLNSKAITDDGLKALQNLQQLAQLDLYRTGITDDGLSHLAGLAALKHLNLAFTGISDAGTDRILLLKGLQVLDLSATQVTSAGLLKLREHPHLEELHLKYLPVGDEVLPLLLSRNPLRAAVLTQSRISAKGHETLKTAFPMAQIEWTEPNHAVAAKVLELGGSVDVHVPNVAEPKALRAGAELPKDFFQLASIKLPRANSTALAPFLEVIAAETKGPGTAPGLDVLVSLDLSGTALDKLDGLAACRQVQELLLAETLVTDANLSSVKMFPQLRRLVLNRTAMRGAGLQYLRELPDLKDLEIGCPTLTDPFIKDLAELKSLQRLSLAGSSISDACIPDLTKCSQLKVVDITGTKISPAGIEALKKGLPECKIVDGTTKPMQIAEPPALDEWLKGRTLLTVAQDGSGQFKSIQAALKALKPGQVVKVLDKGPYRENLDLPVVPEDCGLVSLQQTEVTITDYPKDSGRLGHYFGPMEGLRIHGFLFTMQAKAEEHFGLAFDDPSGLFLEDCHFQAVGPNTQEAHMFVCHWRKREVDKPVWIRNCVLRGRFSLLADSAARGIAVIEHNFIDGPGNQCIWSKGDFRSIVIRNNILGGNVNHADLAFEDVKATETLELSNNTSLSSRPFVFAGNVPKENVTIRNNLRTHAGMVGIVTEQGATQVSDIWQVSHNAYLREAQHGEFGYLKHVFFPPLPHDVLADAKFMATDAVDPNFMRIPLESPQATGGAGGEWPNYIGALKPGPAPKEGDWFTRLRERWPFTLNVSAVR